MTMLAATPVEVYDAFAGAIVTGLAMLAALGIGWVTVGRPIYKKLFDESVNHLGRKRGFFPRIEQRLDEASEFQEASAADRIAIRREMAESTGQLNQKMGELATVVHDHEKRLQANENDISFIKGKEAARAEMAQAAQVLRPAIESAIQEASF